MFIVIVLKLLNNIINAVKALDDPFMNLEYMLYMLKYNRIQKQFEGIISMKQVGGKKFLVVNGTDICDAACSTKRIPQASLGALPAQITRAI